MDTDFVASLGYLALGTRLKRLGERLQADAQTMLDGLGARVPASHYPLLAALDRLGPQGIGELARALGVAQPGVTRSVGMLAGLGLVEVLGSAEDQRRRIISLTKEGRALVARAARTAWPRVERAVADLCAGLDGPLLDQLGALERALAERALAERGLAGRGARRP